MAAPLRLLRGIGLDLETDGALEPDLVPLVCRPDETGRNLDLQARGIDSPKLRFVAKEAYYKAVFPSTQLFMEFGDVRIDFETASDRFFATAVGAKADALEGSKRRALGYFARTGGYLAALAHI